MRPIGIAAALTALLICLSSARAGDIEDCKGTNPEVGIPACQRILQRQLSKQDRVAAIAKIGALYATKGNLGLALEWANKAIALDSNSHLAYYVRGGAHFQSKRYELALTDLDRSITLKSDYAWAYHYRGLVYRGLGKLDLALQEQNTAIRLDNRNPTFFAGRAITYSIRGELDKSLADARRALEIAPGDAKVLAYSAVVWAKKGDFEKARADLKKATSLNPAEKVLPEAEALIAFYAEDYERAIASATRAIELDSNNASAFSIRALAQTYAKNAERGRADAIIALRMDPRSVPAHVAFGRLELQAGKFLEAIRHATTAIGLDPVSAAAYQLRADARQEAGQGSEATSDIKMVLSLKARTPSERAAQLAAAQLLQAIEGTIDDPSRPAPDSTNPPVPAQRDTGQSKRVALVIANARYETMGELQNPLNDGRMIAETLRSVGFGDVDIRTDLRLSDMLQALKEFGDRAAGADWAVIYFAGHGIEMNGVPYLLPVDVRLARDTHIPDETVPLERFLQKTESAKRLRVVILDACRNNPFSTRMVRSAGAARSIGQGLPALEVEGDVLVAYATKHGTFARDGEGPNSPYAMALAKHIPTQDLDIRVMFGRVRDTVRQATDNQQEPYTYGSIGGELHYFRPAR